MLVRKGEMSVSLCNKQHHNKFLSTSLSTTTSIVQYSTAQLLEPIILCVSHSIMIIPSNEVHNFSSTVHPLHWRPLTHHSIPSNGAHLPHNYYNVIISFPEASLPVSSTHNVSSLSTCYWTPFWYQLTTTGVQCTCTTITDQYLQVVCH